MALFTSLDIAASGMTAQRLRMDIIADNIANANTTRTPRGGPFRRHLAVFAARTPPPAGLGLPPGAGWESGPMPFTGVRVIGIGEDNSPFNMVYDPGHPDADAEGYVSYPNINPIVEMVDLIESNRAYEANLSVFEVTKQLLMRTLTMGR